MLLKIHSSDDENPETHVEPDEDQGNAYQLQPCTNTSTGTTNTNAGGHRSKLKLNVVKVGDWVSVRFTEKKFYAKIVKKYVNTMNYQ